MPAYPGRKVPWHSRWSKEPLDVILAVLFNTTQAESRRGSIYELETLYSTLFVVHTYTNWEKP